MTSEQGYAQVLRWTIRQAAQQCEVSTSTIRRYRDLGKFPNAEKTELGWVIPVGDLISSGLKPGKPKPGDDILTEHGQPDASITHELVELRAMLKVEQAHRQAAERIAAERERALEDMRRAMRMLESAPSRTFAPEPTPKSSPVTPIEVQEPAVENPKPKKWFSRILGNS